MNEASRLRDEWLEIMAEYIQQNKEVQQQCLDFTGWVFTTIQQKMRSEHIPLIVALMSLQVLIDQQIANVAVLCEDDKSETRGTTLIQ